jgi:hypothetical protein
MGKLDSLPSMTEQNDRYVYLVAEDGLSDGKAEMGDITVIPEVSQTLNFTNSQTATEIQAEIDALHKYIPQGVSITLQFADGTYNLSSSISVRGFYGEGQFNIRGNTSETAGLHTNQAVHLNFNNSTWGINVTNNSLSLVFIEYLRVTVQDGNTAINLQRQGHSRIRYNYITCGGTTNGSNSAILAHQGNRVQAINNYFSNCYYGIRAYSTSMVNSQNNDDTGTLPRYGLASQRTATIGKNGTQPAGSTANETTAGGGVIWV